MTGLSEITSLEAAQRPARADPSRSFGVPAVHRSRGLVAALLGTLALSWTVADLVGSDRQVLNPAGLPLMAEFWSAAVRPDLSSATLAAMADATLTTVAFAVLGTVLSLVLGAVGAVLMSQTWWLPPGGSRATRVRGTAGLAAARTAAVLPRGVI